MAVDRSHCLPPQDRIDQLIDVIEELETEGLTYDAGCGITIVGTTISAAVDGTSVICEDGVLSAIAASDLEAGCGIEIDAGVVSAAVDGTTISCTGGVLVCMSMAFSTISVSGESDIVADEFMDTVIFAAGPGMTIDTTPGTTTVTFSVDVEDLFTLFTEGPGIDIDTTTISVDLANTDPCLEFDGDTGLQVKIKEDGGLEATSDGIQDKWRYHIVKGRATADYEPGTGTIGIDNVTSINGETPVADPSDVLTCFTERDIYVEEDDIVYAIFNDEGGSLAEKWSVCTALNLSALLRGYAGYDPAETQVFMQVSGVLQWVTVSEC